MGDLMKFNNQISEVFVAGIKFHPLTEPENT